MRQVIRTPRSPLASHVAAALLLVVSGSTAMASPSRPSLDRDAWRTDEFNADWGLGAIKADAAYARGLSGKGSRLGVYDTGSDLSHPEFAGKGHRSLQMAELLGDGSLCTATRVVLGPGACGHSEGDQVAALLTAFADDVPESVRKELLDKYNLEEIGELDSHGTHVAGTIAANRDGVGMHGVSFGSDLVVGNFYADDFVYVDMHEGQPRIRNSSARLAENVMPQLYTQLAYQGVRAVNHSWGSDVGRSAVTESEMDEVLAAPQSQPLLDLLADGSRQNGVIQVWAAGNHSEVGLSPEESPVASVNASVPRVRPEVEPYWLSVVNVDRDNRLQQSMRCGDTARWCLAAPGTGILSTSFTDDSKVDYTLEAGVDGDLEAVVKRLPVHGYEGESGTSMAAPHVTGALGLLFERFPYLDNAQVRDVLLTTATDLGAPGVDDVYGWGLVNLEKAIEGYGQLRVDTHVVMEAHAGGLKVWEGDAWDDWTNDIGGPGALTKSGIGWLRLSGDNSFNGALLREGILELDGRNTLTDAVVVEGGQLRLNGALSATDLDLRGGSALIAAGGVLENSALAINNAVVTFNGLQTGRTTTVGVNGLLHGAGALADTYVSGTIASGGALGTLTINGDYVQTASGRYLAGMALGQRDGLLRVSGTASVDGTLRVLPEAGTYYLGQRFGVLRADGGVQGTFATADFSAFSPFLQFSLDYDANEIRVDITRGQLLASSATTPNQRAVATSADGLAADQGLPGPLTLLFPQQLGAALDGLSGELHAATPMALAESSRYPRDAALNRATVARSPQEDPNEATGVWVQALGGSGTLRGTANTARTASSSNGLLMGIDRQVGKWSVGLLLGNGRTDIQQAQGRAAKARVNGRHVAVHAGSQWGGLGLRAGAGYSAHEIDTTRQVAFAGYVDGLTASYTATTLQAFVEAGYRLGDTAAGLEPYLQLASVNVAVGDVREKGQAAALHGTVDDTTTTVATAGVRFNKGLVASFQQDAWLNVVGGLGYRRAFGDLAGRAQLAFDGGDRFAVRGAPVADGAVVAELGLSAWLSPRQQLELGYNGQFGRDRREHALNARWSLRF